MRVRCLKIPIHKLIPEDEVTQEQNQRPKGISPRIVCTQEEFEDEKAPDEVKNRHDGAEKHIPQAAPSRGCFEGFHGGEGELGADDGGTPSGTGGEASGIGDNPGGGPGIV
jgi:hypothetical protein